MVKRLELRGAGDARTIQEMRALIDTLQETLALSTQNSSVSYSRTYYLIIFRSTG